LGTDIRKLVRADLRVVRHDIVFLCDYFVDSGASTPIAGPKMLRAFPYPLALSGPLGVGAAVSSRIRAVLPLLPLPGKPAFLK
jgi:hypothetical protein